MTPRRLVYYVSDRTGITAEMMGKTLLTQFPAVEFETRTLPFVDSAEKAQAALDEINAAAAREPVRPIVISTLIDDELRSLVLRADALCIDLFAGFIGRLEGEIGLPSSHAVGLTHGIGSPNTYDRRMSAVHYALAHDDGLAAADYDEADVILVGVSRTGKTPTSIYLAMQYGIRAANYPLTPEDLEATGLPKVLQPHRPKLFGFTITPERLSAIRNERRPGSRYAALDNCRQELHTAEGLMRQAAIPVLDTTSKSVEEIAVSLLHQTDLTAHTLR
jgi:hypothetical protein